MKRKPINCSLYARAPKLIFLVFFLDIDDFKIFNDTYGHLKGDEVIQIQSDILLNVFKRQSDIIGRYGGEEFIVFASNMDMKRLLEMGENLIESWHSQNIEHKYGRSECHITRSLGIYSSIPKGDSDLHHFIKKADEALYVVKNSGRNCVKILSD